MSTRRRAAECRVCRHQRLAKLHTREAERLLAIRRREREDYRDRVEAARAAAGKE